MKTTTRRATTAGMLGLLLLGSSLLQSCIHPHRFFRPRHVVHHRVHHHPKAVKPRVRHRPRVVPRRRVRTVNVRVTAPVPR